MTSKKKKVLKLSVKIVNLQRYRFTIACIFLFSVDGKPGYRTLYTLVFQSCESINITEKTKSISFMVSWVAMLVIINPGCAG